MQFEDGGVCLLHASNPRQRVAIAKKLLTPSKDGNMGGASKKVSHCVGSRHIGNIKYHFRTLKNFFVKYGINIFLFVYTTMWDEKGTLYKSFIGFYISVYFGM